MERHYGMDWLRIGAFALLILFHVGMVFVPWGFHVKSTPTYDWATIPMLFTSPWRLSLLFLVSGYASRALLTRSPALGDFVRGRTARLLVPLLFGIVVVVPAQPWVELVTKHGYAGSYWDFLAHDYFRFGTLEGIVLPTWNHLWFVLYLWVYTLALTALLTIPGAGKAQAWFDRAFAGSRAVWLPVPYLWLTQVVLFQRWTDTHYLIGDGVAHLAYFPVFLFGFGMANSRAAMAGMVRWWKPAALLAIASYGVTVAVELRYPGLTPAPQWVSDVMLWARQVQCWMSIVALIGVAERYLNRDHPWRQTLTEAVFPFYIIHQTAIIVVFYWLMPLKLGAGIEFPVLVAATIVSCGAFYWIGRELAWLRPLIGLRRRSRPAPEPAAVPVLV